MNDEKTPIFNIDLLSFDTFILAVRTTDGKIIMRLDSDGTMITTGDFRVEPTLGYYEEFVIPCYPWSLGYYDKEKNEINHPELPEKPIE